MLNKAACVRVGQSDAMSGEVLEVERPWLFVALPATSARGTI